MHSAEKLPCLCLMIGHAGDQRGQAILQDIVVKNKIYQKKLEIIGINYENNN